MKKAIRSSYGICAILIAVLLFSCSKDKEEEPETELPPAKRILGLWNIVHETEILKNTTSGVYSDTTTNITIAPGVFTGEFRDNGYFYMALNDNHPEKDTIDYRFHNDSTLILGGDYYHISDFTKDRMTTTDFYWDNTDSVKHILEFKK